MHQLAFCSRPPWCRPSRHVHVNGVVAESSGHISSVSEAAANAEEKGLQISPPIPKNGKTNRRTLDTRLQQNHVGFKSISSVTSTSSGVTKKVYNHTSLGERKRRLSGVLCFQSNAGCRNIVKKRATP